MPPALGLVAVEIQLESMVAKELDTPVALVMALVALVVAVAVTGSSRTSNFGRVVYRTGPGCKMYRSSISSGAAAG